MILLYEPSMGLAPQIVEEYLRDRAGFSTPRKVSPSWLAEQNTNMALRYATYGSFWRPGAWSWTGEAKMLRDESRI